MVRVLRDGRDGCTDIGELGFGGWRLIWGSWATCVMVTKTAWRLQTKGTKTAMKGLGNAELRMGIARTKKRSRLPLYFCYRWCRQMCRRNILFCKGWPHLVQGVPLDACGQWPAERALTLNTDSLLASAICSLGKLDQMKLQKLCFALRKWHRL